MINCNAITNLFLKLPLELVVVDDYFYLTISQYLATNNAKVKGAICLIQEETKRGEKNEPERASEKSSFTWDAQ